MSAKAFFNALKSHWTPVPPAIADSFLAQTQEFMKLENILRSDPHLACYDVEIYPELETLLGLSRSSLPTSDPRSCLHFFNLQVQIMESVFYAINLSEYHAHQLNRGWINLFRRWTAKPTFRMIWPGLRTTFSKHFVDFAEYHLNLATSIIPQRMDNKDLPKWVELTKPLVKELQQEWPSKEYGHFYQRFISEPLAPKNQDLLLRVTIGDIKLEGVDTTQTNQTLGVAVLKHQAPVTHVMVWVCGAYRRAGIGTALRDALMAQPEMRNAGYVVAELPLSSPNKAGYAEEISGWLRFYEQAGFVRSRAADKLDHLYLERKAELAVHDFY